jgi:hypothetical protein
MSWEIAHSCSRLRHAKNTNLNYCRKSHFLSSTDDNCRGNKLELHFTGGDLNLPWMFPAGTTNPKWPVGFPVEIKVAQNPDEKGLKTGWGVFKAGDRGRIDSNNAKTKAATVNINGKKSFVEFQRILPGGPNPYGSIKVIHDKECKSLSEGPAQTKPPGQDQSDSVFARTCKGILSGFYTERDDLTTPISIQKLTDSPQNV